jgi:type IV pilus assembly protein PilC
MAAFAYEAINAQGLESSGVIHAPDPSTASALLQARGLLAQSLAERGAAGDDEGLRSKFKKVKPKSLQIFARQLATMIEAGVSVVAALVTLEEQTDDAFLAETLAEVRSDVESGVVLSRALARHPKVFDRLFVSMVEAGESSGTLDDVLDRVATQIEKATQLKRRVRGAMIYPAVVLSFAALVLIFMLLFIIPVFVNVFDDLGGELPTLTQWVMHASDLLRGYWYIIFPALIGAFFGLRKLKRTEQGSQTWDRFKLRIPMKIGDVVKKVALARFSRTLSTLVAAGVDIVQALEITGTTAGNHVIESGLADVSTRVQEGARISEPLAENPIFPPMVSQMVKIGEETGELDKMLGKIADFYEDEVDASIQALTSIIEPVLMIGVGVMVGTIVISMYLPMFKMLTLIE